MVELLSPIALPDALAEASLGFRGCWYYGSRGLIVPIDWGQSIYHASGGLFHGRAIVPNSSTTTRSGGVLRFSRLMVLRVTWAYCAPIDWGQSIYESIKQVALPIASICQGTQASARSFTLVSAFRSGISVASSTKFSIE